MLLKLIFLSMVAGSFQASMPEGHVPINPMMSVDTTPASRIEPWFCHDLDCPRYTVNETNQEFETRTYEPSVWVAIKKAFMLYTDDDRRMLFDKLFNYIAGNNTAHMKIPMTAPVVTEVNHGQGPDCESNFTMHFMVPFDLQANPPTPTESDVFIRKVPAMTVYVKQYGGYDTDDLRRENLEALTTSLDAANKQYSRSVFFTAGYDGPYQFKDRHNEVWTLAV